MFHAMYGFFFFFFLFFLGGQWGGVVVSSLIKKQNGLTKVVFICTKISKRERERRCKITKETKNTDSAQNDLKYNNHLLLVEPLPRNDPSLQILSRHVIVRQKRR